MIITLAQHVIQYLIPAFILLAYLCHPTYHPLPVHDISIPKVTLHHIQNYLHNTSNQPFFQISTAIPLSPPNPLLQKVKKKKENKISRMHIKRPRNIQIPTVKFTPCLMCCISNFFNFLPRTQQQKKISSEFFLWSQLCLEGGGFVNITW